MVSPLVIAAVVVLIVLVVLYLRSKDKSKDKPKDKPKAGGPKLPAGVSAWPPDLDKESSQVIGYRMVSGPKNDWIWTAMGQFFDVSGCVAGNSSCHKHGEVALEQACRDAWNLNVYLKTPGWPTEMFPPGKTVSGAVIPQAVTKMAIPVCSSVMVPAC